MMKASRKSQKAQTAIELAVFGAILIFVIGMIVRQTLGTSYAYNIHLKAMRLAMLTSFRYSEGLAGHSGYFKRGVASRNTASILILEDRLSVDSGKYATIDRTPLFASASATHSRHLFMSMDPGEFENIPTTDFYVNGKHFPLTIAGLGTLSVSVVPGDPDPIYYVREVNHTVYNWCQCAGVAASCVDPSGFFRFNLDRDVGNTIDVPNEACEKFTWQWHEITPGDINVDDNENVSVDLDGDLQEENISGPPSGSGINGGLEAQSQQTGVMLIVGGCGLCGSPSKSGFGTDSGQQQGLQIEGTPLLPTAV